MERRKNFSLILLFAVIVVLFIGLFPLYYLGVRAGKTSHKPSAIVARRFADYIDSLPYYSVQLLNDSDNNDLDDTTMPDHSKVVELGTRSFNVLWNIAEDVPFRDMKAVKIIVMPVGYSVRETLTVVKKKPSEEGSSR